MGESSLNCKMPMRTVLLSSIFTGPYGSEYLVTVRAMCFF